MRPLSPAGRERWPLRRAAPTGGEPVYRGLASFAGLVLRHGTREEWDDAAQLPATGGVLVVPNHTSYVDPIAVGRYLIWHGRWPRLLGKAELWRLPVIGWLARSTGQVPVERGTAAARHALDAAADALRGGECVVIYPEGTRTKDPDLWPMTPRTGAARLALSTGVPVLPVAQWGTHDVMPGTQLTWPRPGRTIRIVMGDPVPLDDLRATPDDPASVRAAAERIMTAVTALVEQVRGESAPAGRWDPRAGRRIERG